MSLKVLIDTSIWADYFGGKGQELVESLKNLIRTRRATLCGIVLSELLARVRAKKCRHTLKQTLDAQE
jgi:predicted nucleic acid-binding protein